MLDRKTICFLFALLAPVVSIATLSGCASSEGHYESITRNRQVAYSRWKNEQDRETGPEPRLRGALTLQDALKVALSYNKSLQVALQEKEIARGVIKESYSEALPTVSATADYSRLDEVTSFEIEDRSVSFGDIDNYSAGLEVTQPLYRGGAISAALRAARLASSLADEQVRGAVQTVIFEVAGAYYDTLLAQHLYAVYRDAVKSAEAHLKDVQIKRDQGVASAFDVLRAQVDVSLFEAEMIQQQNRINLTKTELLRLMGSSQASEIQLSDELAYAPMRPVLEEAVRLAYENRPDLYQAELGVRLQREALRVARSKYWPRVDAWFQQRWAKPDPHRSMVIDWGDAWSAGVSASIPIFDGFAREGRIQQERERLRQREIQLVDSEERALLEIQQAMLSLRDAEEFVGSQQLNLQRAREALRLAEVGYREGIEEAVKVTESRAALTQAQGLYYEAVHSHAVARLALQKAMGILGPRAGSTEAPAEVQVQPGEIEEFPAADIGSPPVSGDEGEQQ